MKNDIPLKTILGQGSGRRTQPAIVLTDVQQYEILEAAVPPDPGPGEVVVNVQHGGICGTDYSCWGDKFPFVSRPIISGHELGGVIVKVGSGVMNVQEGDRVAVEPYLPNCGKSNCRNCRKGRTGACRGNITRGVMAQNAGGWQPLYTVRADRVHKSETLSTKDLCLVEMLGVGNHAVERVIGKLPAAGEKPLEGQDLLVIGSGPIGLGAARTAQHWGARVIVADMVDAKLQTAKRVLSDPKTILFGEGAEENFEAVQAVCGAEMPEFVIDATGSNVSMSHAMDFLEDGGVLGYVGITAAALTFLHEAMHLPEIDIRACRNSSGPNFASVIGMMESEDFDATAWFTHGTDFGRFLDDFPVFAKPQTGVLKATVEIPAAS